MATVDRDGKTLQVKKVPAGHLRLVIEEGDDRTETALSPGASRPDDGLHVAWVNREAGQGHPFENTQVQTQVDRG